MDFTVCRSGFQARQRLSGLVSRANIAFVLTRSSPVMSLYLCRLQYKVLTRWLRNHYNKHESIIPFKQLEQGFMYCMIKHWQTFMITDVTISHNFPWKTYAILCM